VFNQVMNERPAEPLCSSSPASVNVCKCFVCDNSITLGRRVKLLDNITGSATDAGSMVENYLECKIALESHLFICRNCNQRLHGNEVRRRNEQNLFRKRHRPSSSIAHVQSFKARKLEVSDFFKLLCTFCLRHPFWIFQLITTRMWSK
jgi:hypothetical protein